MKIFLLLLCIVVQGKFPRDFSFGAATSALQIEGAWLAEGKTLTVWDNLARILGRIADNTTTENTCNSYYIYDQDIAVMKEYGIKHYRLSIQWTRIMPLAREGTFVNQQAVTHYRKVLTALKEAGIEPYVNLYHNDMPAVLFIEGDGRMDVEFPKHFAYYADQCFRLFGDLVKYWFSFDEPWCQSVEGKYEDHELNTKPYKIGHEMLLAHAEAAHIYKTKYKEKQQGQFGINLNMEMAWPDKEDSIEDREAAIRFMMFQIGWFWEPFMTGDYPPVMRQRIGERLPQFTEEQKAKLKGSADFFALNHYSSLIARDGARQTARGFYKDVNVTVLQRKEWKKSDINFSIVPKGMHDALRFVHDTWLKDTPIPIFITENGVSVTEPDIKSGVNDVQRVDFLANYMEEMAKAIQEGVNVKKYFVWSLMDNFEWGHGLSSRFGITRVEYKDGYKRIPKDSLRWYSQLIRDSQ